MVNTVRKGSYFELKAKKQLERWGFVVEKAKRSRFQGTDFYGLFDLICVDGKTVKFIQVADCKKPKEWFARAERFQVPANCSKELWVYRERQGFRLIWIPSKKVKAIG